LRDALNTIWGVPARQTSRLGEVVSVLRERFFSFAVVLGIGFLLLVSLLVNASLAALGTFFGDFMPLPEVLLQAGSSVISFVVITGLFAVVYKFVPDMDIEWRDVLLGAAITSLLFTIGKLGIGLYLGKTAVASAYGAAGSLVIVLLWVYLSAQIFFFGAEFTHVFACHYGSAPELKKSRLILGSRQSVEQISKRGKPRIVMS
jgi:membrane protein